MKYIIVIVTPAKLDETLEALALKGVSRLITSDVRGYGHSTERTKTFRGQVFTVNNMHRVKIEMAVNDEFVEPVIAAIEEIAPSDTKNGGKVFILPLEDCIRARTGERGSTAIG